MALNVNQHVKQYKFYVQLSEELDKWQVPLSKSEMHHHNTPMPVKQCINWKAKGRS